MVGKAQRKATTESSTEHEAAEAGAARAPQRGRGRSALRSVPGDAVRTDELDRLIHERIRLALVSALAVRDWLSFTELKDMLDATDGNLSVHARKLEDAGYLECRKTFEDRMPRTEYRLTKTGRRALETYLGHMERLIRAVQRG